MTDYVGLWIAIIGCVGGGVGVWTTLKERITRLETQLDLFREHTAEYKDIISQNMSELKAMIHQMNEKLGELKDEINKRR